MKGKSKTQKGITLIALIITIVVLLILAVVAINSIQNDGILNYAQNAATDYNKAVANEQSMLQEYEDYLTGINEGFEEYSIGDEVTIGTESFYVIKDSGKTESKVLLLAKQNIDTTNLVQSSSEGTVAFSTESYWGEGTDPYDIKEETLPIPESHIAAKAAYDYGTKVGGAGRLMTYAEALALEENSKFYSKLYETSFWLGSAPAADGTYFMNGTEYHLDATEYDIVTCGVRPVIEISKSKLS